jgi:hypothetical protein
MNTAVDTLLTQYESGRMSRRELVALLGALQDVSFCGLGALGNECTA